MGDAGLPAIAALERRLDRRGRRHVVGVGLVEGLAVERVAEHGQEALAHLALQVAVGQDGVPVEGEEIPRVAGFRRAQDFLHAVHRHQRSQGGRLRERVDDRHPLRRDQRLQEGQYALAGGVEKCGHRKSFCNETELLTGLPMSTYKVTADQYIEVKLSRQPDIHVAIGNEPRSATYPSDEEISHPLAPGESLGNIVPSGTFMILQGPVVVFDRSKRENLCVKEAWGCVEREH